MRYFEAARRGVVAVAAAAFLLAAGIPAAAQTSSLVIAGYGGVSYDADMTDEFTNNFAASLSPVFLYSHGADILFEAELEFGLSGELTTTTLEYAQIDYLGFDNAQLIAGKFLVPFGLFGERFHPTWINKLPTSPILFGHAHGGVASGALMPILSDAGLLARYSLGLGELWSLDVSGYVTQGPTIVTEEEGGGDGHNHALLAPEMALAPGHDETVSSFSIPEVGFGVAFNDNNKNKMLGGRVGFVKAPIFEIHFSAFHAMYDPGSFLDYQGFAVSLQTKWLNTDILAEGAFLRQEFQLEDGGFSFLESPGYYVQMSRRYGAFEPILRWSQLIDAEVAGVTARPGIDELMIGLDYWVSSTVPLKVAYGVHPNRDDQIHVAWAFGF